jgi:hypothetical protein
VAQDFAYLPETAWHAESRGVTAAIGSRFPVRLDLERSGNRISAFRIDMTVNPDESLSMYVSVPFHLFEEKEHTHECFREFLEICSGLFVPDYFLAGTVGEEAQIHSVSSLSEDIERWTGRAFLGDQLAKEVSRLPSDRDGAPAAQESVGVSGLFVSWGGWPDWQPSPKAWQEGVLSALGRVAA